MGLFDSWSRRKETPAPAVALRDTLFGDMPLAAWPPAGSDSTVSPWSDFATARAKIAAGDVQSAIAVWRSIVGQPNLEPRHLLQAWHFLREHGVSPSDDVAKQLLGVVVEVTLDEGLDLLAAYPDHSARYYNYSGASIVWEHPDVSLDGPIDALLAASAAIVHVIGVWTDPRPAAPPAGQARLSFLTPSGLHFGQGDLGALAADPLAGAVIQEATALMQSLIEKHPPV